MKNINALLVSKIENSIYNHKKLILVVLLFFFLCRNFRDSIEGIQSPEDIYEELLLTTLTLYDSTILHEEPRFFVKLIDKAYCLLHLPNYIPIVQVNILLNYFQK